ncbi:Phage portal protein [anaerobic digester metagenome]
MAVIAPGVKQQGIRVFNGAGKGPVGQDLSASIFFNAGRGVPRYEDLYTARRLSLSHTVSIPMTAIKGQVTTTDWAIAPTIDKPTSRHFAACDEIEAFLDGGFNANPVTFDNLCKELLDDILAIDAGVLELVPDEEGWLQEIYARDGATFTKNPDKYGRLPPEGSDEPAYWQVGVQGAVIQSSAIWNADGLPRMSDLSTFGTANLFTYRPITPVPFSRDQVVWIEENPMTWRQYGWSRTQEVQRLAEILLNQDISNLRYFPTTELPEGVLNLAETAEPELVRTREYWRDEIVGKPHKLAMMNAKKVEWIPLRATLQELEFLASQEWYNNLVWMCFGVSANEVGYVQDVNRSTAQEQAEAVWRRTTVPLLELLAGAINRSILPFLEAFWDVAGEVEFRWDPHNPIIERQKRLEQENDLRHGLTTPNRVLQARGEDPVPWGDMPAALFESLCRTQPEWVAAEIIGLENVPEPLYGGGSFLAGPAPAITKAPAADLEDEPEKWRPMITKLARSVGSVIRTELEDLRDQVEDGADPDTVSMSIDLVQPLLRTVRDAHADAMTAGADIAIADVEDEVGKRLGTHIVRIKKSDDFDIRDTLAYRILAQRAARNMRHVNEAVKRRVRETLARVIEEGGGVTDAWVALQETIDGLSSEHARVIARTEIMSAQRYGSQAAGELASDLVDGKTWKSRKIPGRTREWHRVMDDVTVPVDEPFIVPHTGARDQPRDYPREAFVVGDDQPFNCMCDQRLHVRDDLPTDADTLRGYKCLTVHPAPSPRQQEILARHGAPRETLRDLLVRCDAAMSRNQTAETLGIGKATLYEWRKGVGLE